MAIVVVLEWDEVVPNEEQYWDVTDKLGTHERVPEGCEYHVVGVDPGKSVRVCEVWESEEAHGRFMEQVGPFFGGRDTTAVEGHHRAASSSPRHQVDTQICRDALADRPEVPV